MFLFRVMHSVAANPDHHKKSNFWNGCYNTMRLQSCFLTSDVLL